MKPGCAWKCAAAGGTRIVGKMRRVTVVARDALVPPRLACDSRHQEQALELRQRLRLVARLEGEPAVGDLRAARKAPGAPLKYGRCQGIPNEPLQRFLLMLGE